MNGQLKEIPNTSVDLSTRNRPTDVKDDEVIVDTEDADENNKKSKKKKIRKPAAGKLHDRYRYRKTNLIECGIINIEKARSNESHPVGKS